MADKTAAFGLREASRRLVLLKIWLLVSTASAHNIRGLQQPSTSSASESAASSFEIETRDSMDLRIDGPCASEITKYCPGLPSMNSTISNCISELQWRIPGEPPPQPLAAGEVTHRLSQQCTEANARFRAAMYQDIKYNNAFVEACSAAIQLYCDDDFLYPEPGNVLACLRETYQVQKLTSKCRAAVFRNKFEASRNIRLDPQLDQLCGNHSAALCGGLPDQDTIHCLTSNIHHLQWDCQAELFRWEVESADDMRLHPRLQQACLPDKDHFCADVAYGESRMIDCLEDRLNEASFTPSCKKAVREFMVRRASDFRLDYHIRKDCRKDITEICYPDAEDISDVANYDSKVLTCLTQFFSDLSDSTCKRSVAKYAWRASKELRLNGRLRILCDEDRQTTCSHVADENGLLIRCLQDNLHQLKPNCARGMIKQMQSESHDPQFSFMLQTACQTDLNTHCHDMPAESGRRHRCLWQLLLTSESDPTPTSATATSTTTGTAASTSTSTATASATGMSPTCRGEVERDLVLASRDLRLSFTTWQACQMDALALCRAPCLEPNSSTRHASIADIMPSLMASKSSHRAADAADAADATAAAAANAAAAAEQLPVYVPQLCDGAVRRCLDERHEQVHSDRCRSELLSFQSLLAQDPFLLQPRMREACDSDLRRLCGGAHTLMGAEQQRQQQTQEQEVEQKNRAAFICLREHESQLSTECRQLEEQFSLWQVRLQQRTSLARDGLPLNQLGWWLLLLAPISAAAGYAIWRLRTRRQEVTASSAALPLIAEK